MTGIPVPPQKLAYVHVMKTAGTYVSSYLRTNVLGPQGYRSCSAPGRDLTRTELEAVVADPQPPVYVHNHSGNWPSDVLAQMREDGWFRFAFARDPRDQWCSFYFWAQHLEGNFTRQMSLNEFLAHAFADDSPYRETIALMLDFTHLTHELDYFAVYSDDVFDEFLLTYFGHERPSAGGTATRNKSANRGYEHYVSVGAIDDSTVALIEDSSRVNDFEKLKLSPVVRNVQ